MITRHAEEAELIGDKVALMHHGKLLSAGTPREIMEVHGRGYLLEVHINKDRISRFSSLIHPEDPGLLDDIEKAEKLLDQIRDKLEANGFKAWDGFETEFTSEGQLKDIFNLIDYHKNMPTERFILSILGLNIAITMMNNMIEFDQTLELRLDQVMMHDNLL